MSSDIELKKELKISFKKLLKFSKFAGKGACWTAGYITLPLVAEGFRQRNKTNKSSMIPYLLLASTIGLTGYQIVKYGNPFPLETNTIKYETELGVKISSKQKLSTIRGIESIYKTDESSHSSMILKDESFKNLKGIMGRGLEVSVGILSPLGTYLILNSEDKYNQFDQTTTINFPLEQTISYKTPIESLSKTGKFDITCEFRKHETTESYSLRTLKDDSIEYSNPLANANGELTYPKLEGICQQALANNEELIYLKHLEQK